jgi:hypothetical protein
MFKGHFEEAATQTATLPEDDPLAFEFFLGWLYQDTVNKPLSANECIKLFGFAEKYALISLMDNTMDTLLELIKTGRRMLDQVYIENIYRITHESSKMRVFGARCLAFALMNFLDTGIWSTPTHRDEIIIDSLTLIRSLTPQHEFGLFPDPTLDPLCDYHQHGKDEVCPYIKVELCQGKGQHPADSADKC